MATLVNLIVPDPRICPNCSGMNWFYLEDLKVKHLQHRLVKCKRADRHVEVIWQDGDETVELGPVVERREVSQEVAR
jgi:hypothetical protein